MRGRTLAHGRTRAIRNGLMLRMNRITAVGTFNRRKIPTVMKEAADQTPRQQIPVSAAVRGAWVLAMPFFRGNERRAALATLAVILALALVIVGLAVLFTYWQRGLFNALEQKDWPSFMAMLMSWDVDEEGTLTIGFVPLLTVHVLATVYRLYLQQRLQLRWRTWMTDHLTRKYFENRAYYRLELENLGSDNPDQRIAEDINLYTEETLTLGLGLFENIVSMLSFVVLLWGLSREVTFFGDTYAGSLVWIALAYALFGTLLTHFVGRRLIPLNFRQQRVEADFRVAHVRTREYAEAIAFHDGEAGERSRLADRFAAVASNFAQIIGLTKRVTFTVTALTQANLVFPLVIAAPAYFDGHVPLGSVFQTANALNKVVENLSWLVTNYVNLSAYGATVERLTDFAAATRAAQGKGGDISFAAAHAPEAVRCKDVSLCAPTGLPLLQDVGLTIRQGEWVKISGRSGSGKTSLLRLFAGLWPYARGEIALAPGSRMFVPQRRYVPEGTLAAALAYPDPPGRYERGAMASVLDAVGLGSFAQQLDVDANWLQTLSGGEQQRLSFARALLRKPDMLFLDEATSQLDLALEQQVYALVKERLPRCTVVSVAHRDSLAHFHDRFIRIENGMIKDSQALFAEGAH